MWHASPFPTLCPVLHWHERIGLTFCDNSDNVANDLCTGDNVTPICGFDQFNAICPDATYLTDCLTNPFEVACESVTAFTTFALARTNRASFCDDSDNVANALCTDDNVGRVCGFDPFTAICFTGDTYATPRQTACLMDIMEDDSCRGDGACHGFLQGESV